MTDRVKLNPCHRYLLSSLGEIIFSEALCQEELAREVARSTAWVSRTARPLIRAGLITTTKNEDDRRKTYLSLTDAGRDVAKEPET